MLGKKYSNFSLVYQKKLNIFLNLTNLVETQAFFHDHLKNEIDEIYNFLNSNINKYG